MGLYWMVAAFFCITGSLGLAWVNADALVVIEFPKQASSASAVIGTLRFGFGGLAGPLLAWAYDGTPLPVRTVRGCVLQSGLYAVGAGLVHRLLFSHC